MTKSYQPKNVVALIYNELCIFEFGIVAEIFGLHRPEFDTPLYRFSSVSLEGSPLLAAGGVEVSASGTTADLASADLVIVPGWREQKDDIPLAYCDAVRSAHARGARLLSICSGGYVLAAAGLLKNRRATTHWQYAQDFQQRFPAIRVDQNEIYIDLGDIITSAGSSAGIDACLHMVRADYGAKIANSVARRLVMHAHRQGNQAQFIQQPLPKSSHDYQLSKVVTQLRSTLAEPHSITSLADHARMSPRTFQRKFLALTGVPAMQWLKQERVLRSRELLENTALSVESISDAVGFNSAEVLRYHFRQALDICPMEYRKRFRSVHQQ